MLWSVHAGRVHGESLGVPMVLTCFGCSTCAVDAHKSSTEHDLCWNPGEKRQPCCDPFQWNWDLYKCYCNTARELGDFVPFIWRLYTQLSFTITRLIEAVLFIDMLERCNTRLCLNYFSGKNLTVKTSHFKSDLDKVRQFFYYRHASGHGETNVVIPDVRSIHGSC